METAAMRKMIKTSPAEDIPSFTTACLFDLFDFVFAIPYNTNVRKNLDKKIGDLEVRRGERREVLGTWYQYQVRVRRILRRILLLSAKARTGFLPSSLF
jgi:hypothetical protein